MLQWFLKKTYNRKGFTLIELVVVIAILGILAAIAVPRYSASRANAANTAHAANVRTLESAGNMAVADGTTAVTWKSATGKATSGTALGWENYLQKWPAVPSGGTATGAYVVTISGAGVVAVTTE